MGPGVVEHEKRGFYHLIQLIELLMPQSISVTHTASKIFYKILTMWRRFGADKHFNTVLQARADLESMGHCIDSAPGNKCIRSSVIS